MSKICLLIKAICIAILISHITGFNSRSQSKSGLNIAQNPTINLHICPHTHNDLGWLYTMKSYYYGTNPRGCVKCILNNVTLALTQNPSRKFSYVEMGFFKEWWSQQNSTTQAIVKQLIANDQFEFLNAGFSMNDEGCTYYDDIIEQMTVGHRFIKNTFNYTVQTGWHIDPFGHSASQASLFSQMGFNSFLFERIDYQDFEYRIETQNMEMVWKPKTFSDNNFLMAHVNYMKYYLAPFNWCIDMLCWPSTLPRDAIDRIALYVKWVLNQTSIYRTSHILHHVGGDFEWSGDTEALFRGLEVVIAYINSHPEFGINAFFSTPANYSNSVYQEMKARNITNLQIKKDDFMPYEDVPFGYWTGYYTSRASLKQQIRQGGQVLQSLRKILTNVYLSQPKYLSLDFELMDTLLTKLEETMGILQHHDAITGTARQNVTFNYIDLLIKAYQPIFSVIYQIIGNYTNRKFDEHVTYTQCSLNLTAELCDITMGLSNSKRTLIVAALNPNSHSTRVIQLKVPAIPLQVLNEFNTIIPSDVLCDNYTDPNDCSLFFVDRIPTNSIKHFKIQKANTTNNNMVNPLNINDTMAIPINPKRSIEVQNDLTNFVLYTYNNESQVKESYPFSIDYRYYESYYNNSDPNDQPSGAYIFRPMQNYSLPYGEIIQGRVFNAINFVQIQILREAVVTRLRFYKSPKIMHKAIEIETFLDSVDISDGIGKEITINIESCAINNDKIFYTDSNGLEMQERILNYRSPSNITITQPISGNYYPVNSAIYIQDSDTQARMTILNDRSQGGSSLSPGEIELMIQRRILHDDNRGVGEPLNETDPDGKGIRLLMKHYLLFNNDSYKASIQQRVLQYMIDNSVMILLSNSYKRSFEMRPLKNDIFNIDYNLKPLVKLYIRPYDESSFILRIHNLNDQDDRYVQLINENNDNELIILKNLIDEDSYKKLNLVSIEELTLTTVQNRQNMLNNKYDWNNLYINTTIDQNYQNLKFRPLEMRVFNITYNRI